MVLFGPLWVAICLHRHIGSTRRARLCVCVCMCMPVRVCVCTLVSISGSALKKQSSPQRAVLSDNAMTTGLLLPPHPSPPPPSTTCFTSSHRCLHHVQEIQRQNLLKYICTFQPFVCSPPCSLAWMLPRLLLYSTVICKNHLFIVVELCFSLFFLFFLLFCFLLQLRANVCVYHIVSV